MIRHVFAALGIFVLSLSANAVNAADPTMPAGYDWSGPYVGLTAGYGWGDHTQSDSGGDSGKQSLEGFVGGGTLGYNMQMDQIVVGLETDISFSDIDGAFEDQASWGCGGVPSGCFTNIDWFGTARLRLGMPIDSLLPYVTGGLAVGGVESGFVTNPVDHVKETATGWTVGAGIEAAVSDNLTVKAEVLYVDFGKASSGSNLAVDANFTVARVGLNWQF